jgi:hypothetical protein
MITIRQYTIGEFVDKNIDESKITHFCKQAVKSYNKNGTFKKWCFYCTITFLDENNKLDQIRTFNIDEIKIILKGKYHSTHTTEEAYKGKYNSVRKGTSWYYTVDSYTQK